jgi:hypothetical protein
MKRSLLFSSWSFFIMITLLFLQNQLLANDALIKIHDEAKEKSDSLFYVEFPYQQFTTKEYIKNIKGLNQQFEVLAKKSRQADVILKGIFDAYVKNTEEDSFSYTRIIEEIAVSELYLKSNTFLNDTSFVFRQFGGKLMDVISLQVKDALLAKEINKNDFGFKYIKQRLDENQYKIDVEMQNWEKGLMHADNNNYTYLIDRVWGDYPMFCILGLALGIITLIGFYTILTFFIGLLKKR